MKIVPDYLSFWGKASPCDGADNSHHSIAYHSLDVAAVCQILLKKDIQLSEKFQKQLDLSTSDLTTLLTVFTALHDIGKFALDFQQKCLDHWPEDILGEHTPHADCARHDAAGYLLWLKKLKSRIAASLWPDLDTDSMDSLAAAAFGHHGKPAENIDGRYRLKELYGDAEAFALAYCDDILSFFATEPLEIKGEDFKKSAEHASWFAAGFFVLCDWIGSNQTYFPYVSEKMSLEDYWNIHALKKAESAITATGVIPSKISHDVPFNIIAKETFPPSPLQQWALDIPMPEGPTLFIIEDITGAGKTEAAQVLVHRRMAERQATGAYWALPTQATTDAMFERQQELYENLYESDQRPSIVLSHGKAKLSDTFNRIILPEDPEQNIVKNSDETASGACTAWIADDRRRAFLADIGVGTIDQAVLGILPSKYQSLRLLGLSRKTLVADEVHAHDAYLGKLLAELLTFQAALGGDAVLLSATLPTQLRQKFIEAFCKGLDKEKPYKIQNNTDYPLATVVAGTDFKETKVKAAERSARDVSVKRLDQAEDALSVLQHTHKAGACGVYIRNTVDDAIRSWDALKSKGLSPLLFHARFTQYDRLQREDEIRKLFGKKGSTEQRAGKILVTSPILQESLDLDFDVMITDLAPMDLVIQRIGRWRRHRDLRDEHRPKDICDDVLVVSPEPTDEAQDDWYSDAFPKAQRVYKNHAQLWLTAKILFAQENFLVPDNLRGMIEGVFSEDAIFNTPDALQSSAYQDEGERSADTSIASLSSLNFPDGYNNQNMKWDNDERILTRLGAETTTVRLARVLEDGSLYPWAPVTDGDFSKAWALSEIRVRQDQIPLSIQPEASYAKSVSDLKEKWSRWQQDIIVLPMAQDGEIWCCSLTDNNRGFQVKYTVEYGLMIV